MPPNLSNKKHKEFPTLTTLTIPRGQSWWKILWDVYKWYLHDSWGLWWLVIISRVAHACITFYKYVSIIIVRKIQSTPQNKEKQHNPVCNLIKVLNVTSPQKKNMNCHSVSNLKNTSQTGCVPRINHQTTTTKTSSSSGSVDHKAFCKNSSPLKGSVWCD